MQPAIGARLVERLRGEPEVYEPFRLPAERYTSAEWLARERPLFERPRILAASAQIAPGACLPLDDRLLVRAADGTLRGFANACRHRAARLVDGPCAARALVCRYHGWTYDLTGKLIHVPHPTTFAGCEQGRDLHERPVVERHGLVWSGQPELGELDADIAALGLERCAVFASARSTPRCNWKLVIDAFLDGYHIRTLHRESIYPYFLDSMSVAERVGPHIRAVTARRTLRDRADGQFRTVATPSLMVFPATTIIEHPDFVSVVTLRPLAVDLTEYRHVMLIPADRVGETAHWQKNWDLIEGVVFQREDLGACEAVQRGLADGSTDHLLFGSLEHAIRWFHDAVISESVAT